MIAGVYCENRLTDDLMKNFVYDAAVIHNFSRSNYWYSKLYVTTGQTVNQ